MLFSTFAEYLQKLETQPSRLDMTETLADLFKELAADEVKKACYLLQGTLVPAYEPLEFQLSTKMVIRALAHFLPSEKNETEGLFESTDDKSSVSEVEKMYKKNGDLGETVYIIRHTSEVYTPPVSKNKKENSKLSLKDVYARLTEIAFEGGAGSQLRKLEKLEDLLGSVDAIGSKFIVRIILGKLRLGFSTMTMIDGLSWAVTGGKAHRSLLEDAYQKQADIGSLAEYYLKHIKDGESIEVVEKKLQTEYTVVVGIPVVPALCQRLNTSAEIIEKMKKVYAEPKYDGLRVQIHFKRGKDKAEIKVFTRNLEVVTEMFPEVEELGTYITCDSVIFDGEAIGYDPQTDSLLPFQQTMNRKRKHDIAEVAKTIPLRFYVYDILSMDGTDLIAEPLTKRKEILEAVVKKNKTFVVAPYIITEDADELRSFHEKQLAEGLEGAVIKQVSAQYQSGRKGWSWVKIKESEGTSGKLSDTVDALIMGYYSGRGARAQFGLGAILVGVFDANRDDPMFLTITKVGTGMTEEQLREIKELLLPHETQEMPTMYSVHKNLIPDAWVKPAVVVEIAADEVTKSPVHTAGFALRFPRLVKIRSDKKAEDATTLEELSTIQIA